jgi:hypothetical protein
MIYNMEEIRDFLQRIMMHFTFWYIETEKHFGKEKAFLILGNAWVRTFETFTSRLNRATEKGVISGWPSGTKELPLGEIEEMKRLLALNWLANDGVWFQAIEFSEGMDAAKDVNDATWRQFSPFEAAVIKNKLKLDDNSGLEGLKAALNQRIYSFVNDQDITGERENSFIFRMVDCRVQSARKRKGMAPYPCKSGGIAEYSSFATAIDSRILTEVVTCPPDPLPEDHYCAWRFYME